MPPPPTPHFVAWVSCATCKQRFTGLVELRPAIALWAKYARAVETDGKRLVAPGDAGDHTEAAWLQRGVMDVRTRTLGPEHSNMLNAASNTSLARFRASESA